MTAWQRKRQKARSAAKRAELRNTSIAEAIKLLDEAKRKADAELQQRMIDLANDTSPRVGTNAGAPQPRHDVDSTKGTK